MVNLVQSGGQLRPVEHSTCYVRQTDSLNDWLPNYFCNLSNDVDIIEQKKTQTNVTNLYDMLVIQVCYIYIIWGTVKTKQQYNLQINTYIESLTVKTN